eukprot:11099945-Alexandrium_andersonii.AAC.1
MGEGLPTTQQSPPRAHRCARWAGFYTALHDLFAFDAVPAVSCACGDAAPAPCFVGGGGG